MNNLELARQVISQLMQSPDNTAFPPLGLSQFANVSTPEDVALTALPIGRIAKVGKLAGVGKLAKRIHPEDIREVEAAIDIIRGRNKQFLPEANNTIQNILEFYLPKLKNVNTSQAMKAIEQLIDKGIRK